MGEMRNGCTTLFRKPEGNVAGEISCFLSRSIWTLFYL
jgi:hypothetical protein